MKDKDIIAICKKTADVGEAKHEDFAHYIEVIKRKKRGVGETENPYMTVAGRLAMALVDHAAQDAKLEQLPTQILESNGERITLQVCFQSSLYGTRYGIASSRRDAGGAEGSNPWEVAETSAIGRALGNYGYGNLPGAGRASAEDMRRVVPGRPRQAATTKPEGDGHWIEDPKVRNKFWAYAKGDPETGGLGLTEGQVHKALTPHRMSEPYSSVKEFKGTKETARDLLKAYAESLADIAAAAQEGEGEEPPVAEGDLPQPGDVIDVDKIPW